MIVDILSNRGLYKGLSSNLDTAFKWIMDTDVANLDMGEYRVSEGVRAIVQEYTTAPENHNKYEAHRKNIDIQYVARGEEMMIVHPLEGLKPYSSYDEDNDIIFFQSNGEGSRIVVAEGMFAVFYPQDAHIPGLAVDSPSSVLKVVLKVAVAPD